MIRARRAAALTAASLALAGCEVDFVGVGAEDAIIHAVASITSLHGDSLTGNLTVELPPGAGPLTVVVGGRSVPAVEHAGGGVSYQARLAPDSLHPSIRLVIESAAGSVFDGFIPLLARSGPAEWSPTSLLLPLAHGASAEEPDASTWFVVLADSAGAQLLHLWSSNVPLPVPFRIGRELIPEAAAEAEVLLAHRFRLRPGLSTLRLVAVSRVVFPLP